MKIFHIQWKWNIPNTLSLLRLLLVPAFAVLYLMHRDVWAFGVLLLSGATDALDGFIARQLNQITECGKLMDPIADKLTQVTVVICLTTRYREILPLTVICFFKELCQAIGGLIMLRSRQQVRSAKWFGKVSTVVFYACMLVIVLWYDVLAEKAFWALIGLLLLTAATMLSAFLGYLRIFIKILRGDAGTNDAAPSAPSAEKA